jgi:hypothetical protein
MKNKKHILYIIFTGSGLIIITALFFALHIIPERVSGKKFPAAI